MLAANTWTSIRNWLYLDMAAFGRYNAVAWSYLERKGYTPTMQAGDMALLGSARPDFLAFNYYSSTTAAANSEAEDADQPAGELDLAFSEPGMYRQHRNEHLEKSPFGWEIDPVGFRITLREVYDRYRMPLLVTENGLGAFDQLEPGDVVKDPYRIDYLRKHIQQAQLAITDGVDLIGYCPWSAIDLISTHQGAGKRYGFVFVHRGESDLKDLRRIKKQSFQWYQWVIRTNGADLSD